MTVFDRVFRRRVAAHAPELASDEGEPRYVVIKTDNRVVADSERGRLVRRAFLDGIDLNSQTPVIVDVSKLGRVSLDAAEEMLIPWLRNPAAHAPVAIKTYSTLARKTFDSALKRGHQVAYWIPRAPALETDPELIGATTPADETCLAFLRDRAGVASSDDLDQQQTAAMDAAAARGVLLKLPHNGASIYREPFPLTNAAVAGRME